MDTADDTIVTFLNIQQNTSAEIVMRNG